MINPNMTRLDLEWIKKVNLQFLEEGEKRASEYWRRNSNYPGVKECRKKYALSEKGKAARKRVDRKRQKAIRIKSLPKIERQMLKKFYQECPCDLEVDHIIPLGKGGTHTLSNLQWIKKEINTRKHTKILLKKEHFPQCVIKHRNGDF